MGVDDDLRALVTKFCSRRAGLEAEYLIKEGYPHVGLVKLYVPKLIQRQKHGRWFMKKFIKILDKYNRPAKLMASEKYTKKLASLLKFYGFYGVSPIEEESTADGFKQRLLERPQKTPPPEG